MYFEMRPSILTQEITWILAEARLPQAGVDVIGQVWSKGSWDPEIEIVKTIHESHWIQGETPWRLRNGAFPEGTVLRWIPMPMIDDMALSWYKQ